MRLSKSLSWGLSFILVFSVWGSLSRAEDLTITTYYPSPFGVYRALRFFPTDTAPVTCDSLNEGSVYYDDGSGSEPRGLKICGGSGSTFSWQDLDNYWALATSGKFTPWYGGDKELPTIFTSIY